MNMEFNEISTQDLVHANGLEIYFVAELLCMSVEESNNDSLSNKRRRKFDEVAVESDPSKYHWHNNL